MTSKEVMHGLTDGQQMSSSLFFITICPGCKRRTQLQIRYLGKDINCQACEKQFLAISSDSFSAALDDPIDYWIRFTEASPNNSPDASGLGLYRNEFSDWDIGRNPR